MKMTTKRNKNTTNGCKRHIWSGCRDDTLCCSRSGEDWRLVADLRGCTLLRWRWCLTLTSTLSQGRPERWAVKSIVTSDSERFVTHGKMWLPFKWGVKGQSAFAAAERKRIKRISCSELDENKKKKNKNHVLSLQMSQEKVSVRAVIFLQPHWHQCSVSLTP